MVEVRDFENGKKPWPCTTTPSRRCKCGILATKGVVPSELGYGYYCGNSYGEYWKGRTCDWESFEGWYDLMLQLGRTKEKMKIRKEYNVTLPLESFLSGPVLQDLRREYGKKVAEKATLEDCIVYSRRNRSKYPQPLTDRELLANYEKKKEEEMERQMLREERANKATQMEAMKTLVGDLPTEDHQSDRKGKAVDISNWVGNKDDDWSEDKLLENCDSD
ncbi:hypothetical protein PVAP13_7KG028958 [Panicum virgatum]|uniref:Uncharacterized protein n=1 Tax=Panicum virgatum TaxID=38727 RepID=A0A8T0QKS0_PANVG|nr:hypothetical protein PVAP13_7KG028958 [Panicum virgatum]